MDSWKNYLMLKNEKKFHWKKSVFPEREKFVSKTHLKNICNYFLMIFLRKNEVTTLSTGSQKCNSSRKEKTGHENRLRKWLFCSVRCQNTIWTVREWDVCFYMNIDPAVTMQRALPIRHFVSACVLMFIFIILLLCLRCFFGYKNNNRISCMYTVSSQQ